jgi:hypothetical protein
MMEASSAAVPERFDSVQEEEQDRSPDLSEKNEPGESLFENPGKEENSAKGGLLTA